MNEPACPAYLAGSLRDRWDVLAPPLIRAGVIDALSADILAKYILAENEYLQISNLVQSAIRDEDGDAASSWIAAQDRLTKQILALGAELGITPRERRSRGICRA